MFEYNKLRGRIVEKYRTLARFAEAVGCSEVAMYNKIAGKTRFSQADIILWCDLLEIERDEIGSYFFA